jgi:TnpA family transposase
MSCGTRVWTLAAANARIVDCHAKLGFAERWGGGEVASIDGLRFVVPRRTIHAAYNRRYFDRRRGVTLLGTTADHYAGLHTIVITGTQPDAPYILDGLLDPQTSVRPREIVTDTAGYTDVIFGLFRLLGYRYSPRLADAGGATFWRINSTDYGPLNSLARHQVNTRLVAQHYDDLLRVAGSLLQRHTTASHSPGRCAATPATSPRSPAHCSTSGAPRKRSTYWTTATTSRSAGGS